MNILSMSIFLVLVAAVTVRAWTAQGSLAAHDRWTLITGFATAVAAFAIVSLPLNMLILPETIWFIGVGLLAGGVTGAVLRWPDLAWDAGTNRLRRALRVIATLCICLLLMGVAVI